MRNIDPYCNLFNFVNARYYLEDHINEVIKRNNLSEDEFSIMSLNIRSLLRTLANYVISYRVSTTNSQLLV